jgi:O-antigen ligase
VSDAGITTATDVLLAALRRRQVVDLVRSMSFIGALMLTWVSLQPFSDLGNALIADLTNGNTTSTYVAFGGLAMLMLALVVRDNKPALLSLLSPGYLLFGGWILITVLLSHDAGTSIRRLALTVCVVAVAAMLTLLARSADELLRWFAIATLLFLAICYLGLLLVPHLSMHLATDAQEPALAGDWRGPFGHKNLAAAVLAMLVFVGISVAGSGRWLSGVTIVLFALVFLVFSGGKSSLMLCLGVLMLSSLVPLLPWPWLRAAMLFTPLIVLNMLSIGTVMSPALAAIAAKLPLDASFTGRTDIWAFGIETAKLRLWTGYGFSAFWGSDAVRNLPEGMEWAATAAHSHNGYLDTTLTMGLPGLLILIAVLVIFPFRDFQAATRGGNNGPLAVMLFRIWLFGIYLSSFESFYFDRDDPIWVTFLVAIFGLHYLARFRAKA